MTRIRTFDELIDYIIQFPAHTDLEVDGNFFNHKWLDKYKSSIADDDGQNADYRIPLKDGRGIHVKEYDGYYKVHWDNSDLATDPLGHLLDDAPHHIPTILGTIVAALAIGYVLSKK